MYSSDATHMITQQPRRRRTLGDIIKLEAGQWPMEKQRRSEIDWYALAPDDVAYNQIRWERFQTVLAMRDAGMTLKEIGVRFDLTSGMISQYAREADRWRRKPSSLRLSPVEQYFANPLFKPSRRGRGPELAGD